MVGDNHAFSFSIRSTFDADVNFELRDSKTYVTGSVGNLDLADFTFVPATVEEIDLEEIIEIFKPTILQFIKDSANGSLSQGLSLPVIDYVIKDLFNVEFDDLLVKMKDKYMQL